MIVLTPWAQSVLRVHMSNDAKRYLQKFYPKDLYFFLLNKDRETFLKINLFLQPKKKWKRGQVLQKLLFLFLEGPYTCEYIVFTLIII